VSDPQRDVGVTTFTTIHDGACDDAELLRRIAQGDESAMAAFYREHGRVVLGQHLASCELCRTETTRWNLVAEGVRGLAAAAPEEEAQPARRRRAGPHALAGHRRRTMLAVGAAAALVLGGAGYLSATALIGHPLGTVLTAVSGCPALKLASGTLRPGDRGLRGHRREPGRAEPAAFGG
jgi:hypothetical protein